ncbi:MAG: thioredoxin domain-containing protein [Phototrophicales bacterium]|nr:MAG: thioredoxin domain-containing protein [Phototrophicales bacterium]
MNRLQHETSPYLLQHAHNPVDWYPWGDEAFAKAKEEDKPILLSVGYSSCHWCHVMAHESFEDPETAALMNELFINVKVDREERPDVDDIYMQATLVFTRGHGGWPMTVFLTPEGKPFHAGTYYPPEPRYIHGQLAMPSFRQVLIAVADYYKNRREEVERMAADVVGAIQSGMGIPLVTEDAQLEAEWLKKAAQKLIAQADMIHGGLHRNQPKFPSPMNLEFLLRYYSTSQDQTFLEPVLFTLRKMAHGGIYDQLGGGFHRYSVDHRWLVPHFEKMLYDNAQLARVYLHAYQITQEKFYADIVLDILSYVQREMRDDCGGFYSAQDADSEGVEGKFFVWSADEFHEALSSDFSEKEIAALMDFYDITPNGNFEGHNIPNRLTDVATVADEHHMTIDALLELAQRARSILFAYREKRIKPARDDKMIAAWNGMMLAAFAEAARVLDDERYQAIAIQNAEFILSAMQTSEGRLYRTHKRHTPDEGESKILGYLEDYANVIDGLIELYQTTFDARWFIEAVRLSDIVFAHFFEDGKLYDTSDEHESLMARPRAVQDNATPAAANLMAWNWLRLFGYTSDSRYYDSAVAILASLSIAMQEYPSAFGVALSALHLAVYGVQEVAIVGDPHLEETRHLLNIIQKPYRPRVITALVSYPSDDVQPPLLAKRSYLNDKPTVYVCQNFVCQRPVNTPDEVESLLS